MPKQHESLPTWGVVIIVIAVAVVLMLIIYSVAEKDRIKQWDKEIKADWETIETNTDVRKTSNKTADQKVMTDTAMVTADAATLTSTGKTPTWTELKLWLEDRDAVNCVITDDTTGEQTIYQADTDFERVRFQNNNGGVIVDDERMYVWDSTSMTGVKTRTDLSSLDRTLMLNLTNNQQTATSGDEMTISCDNTRSVDTRRPSGINWVESTTISE